MIKAVVLVVIGLLPLLRGGPVRFWALGLALFVALLPRVVRRIEEWFATALLAVVWIVIMTPFGWFYRTFVNRDLLQLRFAREAATYWMERQSEAPNGKQY